MKTSNRMCKRLLSALFVGILLCTALPSQAALNTWVKLLPAAFGSVALVAASDPTAAPLVFAGTSLATTGLLRSDDDGATWARVLSQAARSVAGDPNTPGVVYAATTAGLFKSSDYGATWGLLNAGVKAWIVVNTGNPLILYGDNLRSSDGGATWTPMTGLPLFTGTGNSSPHIQVTKSDPLRLIAFAGQGRPYMSLDGGLAWTDMKSTAFQPRLQRTDVYGLTIDPVEAERFYVAYCNSVQRFFPGGTSMASASGDQFNVTVDPGAHANVLITGQMGVTYKSVNFGQSYTPYVKFPGSDTTPGRQIMDTRGRIYVADDSGLWMIQTRSEICTGQDQDSDGYYAVAGCGTPVDCNDTDQTVYPGRIENCLDYLDNNCNGLVDFADGYCIANCADIDSDGYLPVCGGGTDCNNKDATVFPGALEICDQKDNDCDGFWDEDFDLDNDRYTSCDGDCNDDDADVFPWAEEKKMDGIDQDCNGFDLTIRVVKAVHYDQKQTLTVEALSKLNEAAGLTLFVDIVTRVPMNWDAKRKLWSVTITGVPYKPYAVLVEGIEGYESSLVQ
ncbi:MAG: MopE-related protein [Candidatus Methylomirabilia bacterium]